MKLNGWQRIGVVASVVWALGMGGYWWVSSMNKENAFESFSYRICYEANRLTKNQNCDLELQRPPDFIANLAIETAIIGIVPIPIGWGVVYGLFGITRWVRRGFQKA